jgi:hypothetical protein
MYGCISGAGRSEEASVKTSPGKLNAMPVVKMKQPISAKEVLVINQLIENVPGGVLMSDKLQFVEPARYNEKLRFVGLST